MFYKKYQINGYSILINKILLDTNINFINYLSHPIDIFNYQILTFKNSKRTKAGCIKLNNQVYFFKSYNNRGIIYTIKSIVRKSRPTKVLTIYKQLNKLNINTPTVLATIEKRCLNMVLESYILTEFIDGYKIKDILSKKELNEQYTILRYISHFISQIHNKSVFHGDLKANNLLLDKNNLSKIWLLDLDGVKIRNSISLKERIKDVARFLVSIDYMISEKSLLFFIDNYIKKTDVLIERDSFIKNLDLEIAKIKKRHEQKAKHKR